MFFLVIFLLELLTTEHLHFVLFNFLYIFVVRSSGVVPLMRSPLEWSRVFLSSFRLLGRSPLSVDDGRLSALISSSDEMAPSSSEPMSR